ncbi:gibberellin 2-beta-dioxygenase 2-like [Rhodamnia argentea]|uniref:gibberellin 2beta-dioxygenase n=1 Tax=Rhodamnia argentea TaxID=178133 RepID=A0A8B8NEY0_9MYRT|nr:gibberellin 2-beta-dioxygenase 2-like [Rhodamnia argentea]
MVVASPNPRRAEKIQAVELPVIDLSPSGRSAAPALIVEACEKYGFFKVINHGVPGEVVSRMDEASAGFFARPDSEKRGAGPADPFGYGSKSIGFNGDVGEVEYLLLETDPVLVSRRSVGISDDPNRFSAAVNSYIEAVRELACDILDLMAQGLRAPDASVFSRLLRAVDSDSVFRINHYPRRSGAVLLRGGGGVGEEVGFGEHSDPQILTVLRSNDVGGLQISLEDGVWTPVPPDPAAFWVNVGDVLQAMTNGRFLSVRHRALTNPFKSRTSMAFFGAPPLDAWIAPQRELLDPRRPCIYKPFTWAEYKKAVYSLRLGDTRLDLFRARKEGGID